VPSFLCKTLGAPKQLPTEKRYQVLYPHAKFGGDQFTHGDTRPKKESSLCFLFVMLGVAYFGLADLPQCLALYSFAFYRLIFTGFRAFFRRRNIFSNRPHHFELKC